MSGSDLINYFYNFDPHAVNLLSLDFGSVRSLLADDSLPKGRKLSKILHDFETSNKHNATQVIPYLVAHTRGALISVDVYNTLMSIHNAICFFMDMKPFIHSGDYTIFNVDCFRSVKRSLFMNDQHLIPQESRYYNPTSLRTYYYAKFRPNVKGASKLIHFVEDVFERANVKIEGEDSMRTLYSVAQDSPGLLLLNREEFKKSERFEFDKIYQNLCEVFFKELVIQSYCYNPKQILHLDFSKRIDGRHVSSHEREYVRSTLPPYNEPNFLDALFDKDCEVHKFILKSPKYKEIEDNFYEHYYMFHSVNGDSYLRPASNRKDDTISLNWNNSLCNSTYLSDKIKFEVEKAGQEHAKDLADKNLLTE